MNEYGYKKINNKDKKPLFVVEIRHEYEAVFAVFATAERAKAYLKLDLEDSSVLKELSAEQRAFAYNLQTVRDRLEKAGKDASADSVIDKIKFKGTDMSAVNDTDTNAENTTNS